MKYARRAFAAAAVTTLMCLPSASARIETDTDAPFEQMLRADSGLLQTYENYTALINARIQRTSSAKNAWTNQVRANALAIVSGMMDARIFRDQKICREVTAGDSEMPFPPTCRTVMGLVPTTERVSANP